MGTRLLSRFVEIWATVLIGQYSAPCQKTILASLSKTSRAFRRFVSVLALAGWQLLDTGNSWTPIEKQSNSWTPSNSDSGTRHRLPDVDFRTPIEAFILTQFLL